MPKQLEASVRKAARREGVSVSEYVRKTLETRMLADQVVRPSAYELGKDLFGKYGSGRSDLSRNAEQIVGEMIRAKAKKSRNRRSTT